jgi:hypothetical protein
MAFIVRVLAQLTTNQCLNAIDTLEEGALAFAPASSECERRDAVRLVCAAALASLFTEKVRVRVLVLHLTRGCT